MSNGSGHDALGERVVVVGRWSDPQDNKLTLQDFSQKGQPFIPIFSDEEQFKEQMKGSGFEEQGLLIETKFLASILTGRETLLLNPGGPHPRKLSKADLE